MTATAPPANRELLDAFAADVRAMAHFAAKVYRLDPDDVRQQMAAVVLAAGRKFDPHRGWGFRRWLWMAWRSSAGRELRRPRPLSLDALTTPAGEPMELPAAGPQPDEAADRADRVAAVRAAVAGLDDPRRRAVVEAVFGLNGRPPETAVAVAARLGVTPSRASQLARDALDRLRLPLANLAD